MLQTWRRNLIRQMVRVIAYLFQLKDEEVPRVVLMFLYSLMAVGTFILARIVRDALFLSLPGQQGTRNLPVLMAISAVCVSVMAYLYSQVTNRLRRDKMILAVNMILCLLQMIIYGLLQWTEPDHHAFLFKINYVYVEVMGSLQVILFWTLASDLFDPRAAKRIFAIIGGGAVMANLLAFGVRPMVQFLNGTQHLLPILALMMLFCMAIVFVLGQESAQQLEQNWSQNLAARRQPKQTIQITSDSGRIWSNRHLSIIALVVVVTFLTTSLIDFQFKVIAASQFGGNRDALSHYFSMFYGFGGILACFVQFVLANRILQSSGIRRALLLLPASLLLFSVSLALSPWLFPLLWAVSLAKGSENVLRYTINDVSMNLLYVPVDSRLRARAKAFIDGILKPGSIAVAAAVIEGLKLLYGSNPRMYQHLSWVAAGLLLGWIYLIFRAHKEYLSTLVNSMEKSGLDLEQSQFSIQDESAIAVLRQSLHSQEPRQVLHALELLRHVRTKSVVWTRELVPLLSSQHNEICMAALDALIQYYRTNRSRRTDDDTPWTPSDETEVALEQKLFELIEAAHSNVRAKSIELLCVLLQEEAISPLLDYLEDNSAEVRSATIVGLIRFGGLDGILHAATHLKNMLESPDANLRKMGAFIIGSLETRSFYQPLRRLIKDPALEVRLSAIEAAGKLCNVKLIPDLLEALTHRDTSQKAGHALARYGQDVLPHLAPYLENHAGLPLRMATLRVISLVGGPVAIQLVEPLIFCKERRLCIRSLRVLQRLTANDPTLQVNDQRLLQLLENDFQEYYRWQRERDILSRELQHHTLIREAIHEHCESILVSVFETLMLLYPRRQIQLIAHHLQQKDVRMRSYALELLDNTISLEIKRHLLPILEENVLLDEHKPEEQDVTTDQILSRMSEYNNSWMNACVLWTIGRNRLMSHQSYVKQALDHKDPMVRETALMTSGTLLEKSEYHALLQRFERDPSPLVARFARAQLQAQGA